MPRQEGSKNENTYHYQVYYMDSFEGEKSKLFRTCADIQKLFKISKSSVYNYYMGLSKNKSHESMLEIKKLNPPIQRFQKIIINFD